MELNSFGAILRFALQLEEEAAGYFADAKEHAASAHLKSILSDLESDGRRLRRRLERIRREQVNEMLLESIEGLDATTYEITVDPSEGSDDLGIAATAEMLETRALRFYSNAAARVSIPEVRRSFTQLAEHHATRCEQLLGVVQSLTSE